MEQILSPLRGAWGPALNLLPPQRGYDHPVTDACPRSLVRIVCRLVKTQSELGVLVRLFALSDLHLSNPINREALDSVPSLREDWLILAGDVVDGLHQLDWCFHALTRKFKQLVWVPGNHELWSRPGRQDEPRGVQLYEKLVEIAHCHGVITPNDPYPVFPHASGMVLLAPLFLLYDYSFRPSTVRIDEVVTWAERENSVCADEYLLHPDPFPDRGAWCAALCAETAARLEACPPDLPKILINHFPLEEKPAVLPKAPRFTPWCGTRRTRGWHRRFNARAVVFGHLHMRGTWWIDGVPFQEVSLGYPSQWDRRRGIGDYLQEVTLAPTGGIAK